MGKGPHDDVEVRVAYALLHAEALAFFLSGVRLTELRLMVRDHVHLVMLKGTRKGKKLIAFVPGNTWRDALTCCATSLDTNAVPWRDDKPPPNG